MHHSWSQSHNPYNVPSLSSIAPEGWGPKEGGNATSPLHSRGSPNKGGQNQKSKPPLGVTMMPLGAPSISKYGSLVRPDALHCARTALEAPPNREEYTRCKTFV